MAVIREESILVRVSRLVKNKDIAESTNPDLSVSVIENIETIVQELVGAGAVVDVEILPTQVTK